MQYLRCRELPDGAIIVDATLGTGGHAEAILAANSGCRVIGIDLDADSLEVARQRLTPYASRVTYVPGNYRDVCAHLDKLGIHQVDGLLIDVGVSLWQLDSPERGFSFRTDAALSMVYDRSQKRTGYDLVNTLAERELASLIRDYSGERWADRIARSIVAARRRQPIRTTAQLVDIVTAAIPARHRSGDLHPATRTFAALRQATNEDLVSLELGLPNAATVLANDAVLVVLSYSSKEDSIVKHQLKRMALPKPRRQRYPRQLTPGRPTSPLRDLAPLEGQGRQADTDSTEAGPRLRILTPKPVLPTPHEVRANPRCRGARLRAAARVF